MNRTQDWLEQAKHDLAHARQSIGLEHFAWACFAAQQAAERAAKALHLHLGTVAWGHSVFELLDGLPSDLRPQMELLERGKVLDRFYIPPRYANAHPAGPPYRYYVRADAEQAVIVAQEVIEYCERHILSPRPPKVGGNGGREQIERGLQAYVQALAGDPLVLAIVLFGSLARGEGTAMSDADVLLILARSSKPFHVRIPDYLRSGIGIPMDVFPYTLVEARRMLSEGTGVVPVALREGVWLLDRAQIRQGLMEEQEVMGV